MQPTIEKQTHDTGRVRVVREYENGVQLSAYGASVVEADERLRAEQARRGLPTWFRFAIRSLDDEVTSVSGRDAGVTAARAS